MLRAKRVIPYVILVAVAASAGPFALVSPAAAQPKKAAAKRPPIRQELPDGARKAWDSATELFGNNDYAGALVEFTRAYELSKNPRVLFNIGVCEKFLKHYARASARWNQQIGEMQGKLTFEEEREIRDAISTVQSFVSTLEVNANEDGAVLLVDNIEAGQTPFKAPVPIDVGRHALVLRKEGFQEKSETVDIVSGQPKKVAFKIEPTVKKALVTIQVTGAPAANIVIDGTDMGQAPFKGEVTVGRHTFEARAGGYLPVRQTSEVVYKEPLNLTLTLAQERHEGKVKVSVSQPTATIEIDGKIVGSGEWEGVLPAGGHQLVVRKPGFQTYSTDVALNDDQVRTVNVPLQAEAKGAAWVWWTVGTLAVIGGGAAVSYVVFKPTETTPVSGSIDPQQPIFNANFPVR